MRDPVPKDLQPSTVQIPNSESSVSNRRRRRMRAYANL